MAYVVHTADSVAAYLQNLEGISEEGLRHVVEEYLRDLSLRPEHFLERNPFAHESYKFWYDFSIIDRGTLHSFWFVVDGSSMSNGIVHVLYVEHEVIEGPFY